MRQRVARVPVESRCRHHLLFLNVLMPVTHPLDLCIAATHRTKKVGDVCGVDVPSEPQHVTGFRSRLFADVIRQVRPFWIAMGLQVLEYCHGTNMDEHTDA